MTEHESFEAELAQLVHRHRDGGTPDREIVDWLICYVDIVTLDSDEGL